MACLRFATPSILGIYFVVVGQSGSFKLPLMILTPVPLTLIGITIGHRMFGAPFTATSMIGFIALAGIIVRNSIPTDAESSGTYNFTQPGNIAGKATGLNS